MLVVVVLVFVSSDLIYTFFLVLFATVAAINLIKQKFESVHSKVPDTDENCKNEKEKLNMLLKKNYLPKILRTNELYTV